MKETTLKEKAIVRLISDELESDSISHVRESFSARESIKYIAFESEKIFAANYADVVSRSKAREMMRTLVAQEIANNILNRVPKNKQRETINDMGYYTL